MQNPRHLCDNSQSPPHIVQTTAFGAIPCQGGVQLTLNEKYNIMY